MNILLQFIFSLAISYMVSIGIVFCCKLHPRLSGRRHDLNAVQSAHSVPTPRIGGVAIFSSLTVTAFFLPTALYADYFWLLAATCIVFATGLLEDMGFHVSPARRLIASVVAGFAFVLVTGHWIDRIGVAFLDGLIAQWWMGVPLALFVTAGASHAFNLIDGVNGLSSFTALVCCGALFTMSLQSGNPEVAAVFLLVGGATFGFMVINFPLGHIFLGDAGAYLLGFVISWLGVMLILAAPQVSPWAILLAMFWPIADTAMAIFRRTTKSNRSFHPDYMHAHQVVMRTLEIVWFGTKNRRITNPLSTIVLSPFIAAPPLTAVFVWHSSAWSFFFVCLYAVLFHVSYVQLVAYIQRRGFRRRSSTRVLSASTPQDPEKASHAIAQVHHAENDFLAEKVDG